MQGVSADLLVPILLAPLALVSLVALFLPGARAASFALLTALLGLGTAVAASHIFLSSVGAQPVGIWPGAGLSLCWLGVVGAVVLALRRHAQQFHQVDYRSHSAVTQDYRTHSAGDFWYIASKVFQHHFLAR